MATARRPSTAEHTWVNGRRGSFSLVSGEPTAHLHMGLIAKDAAAVEAFHRAALESGYRGGRPPATRRVNGRDGHAASVLDRAADTIEIVRRDTNR